MAQNKWKQPNKESKNIKFINPSKELASKEKSHAELVKFSFKYLAATDVFKYNDKESGYFLCFIDRLKGICCLTCEEFRTKYQKTLRNHYIDWKDTTQSDFGLPNEEQLVDRPFQFALSSNEHGRIIGFFIDKTFHVVWFDPDHEVYT